MTKTQRKRLAFLANWLETNVVANKFCETWCHTQIKYRDNIKEECGTAFCAGGWATQIPEFNKLGFRAVNNIVFDYEPEYKSYYGFDACEKFFGTPEPFNPHIYGVGEFNLVNVIAKLREYAKSEDENDY